MAEWNQKIATTLKQELEGVKDSDLRFFRIEEYLRMIKRVDDFSADCHQCKQLKLEIEQEMKAVGRAIKHVGKERRDYDRHIDRLARHMKKEHGFYAPFFYTYSFSFFFTLIGAVIGLAVSLFFPAFDRWFFIVPALVAGLIAGQIVGTQKDAKIRSNNKIL